MLHRLLTPLMLEIGQVTADADGPLDHNSGGWTIVQRTWGSGNKTYVSARDKVFTFVLESEISHTGLLLGEKAY